MFDPKQLQKMSRDLQAGMETMKEDLAKKTVEGQAGGGAVSVTVDGNQQVQSIKIAREAVDPDDVEMLEDLVRAAMNQAVEKSKEIQQERINQLTGGIKLPNLPFL